jgi:hypothetical protein
MKNRLLENLEVRQLFSLSPAADSAHPAGVLLGGVPVYSWYFGCVPSAVGMA